MFYWDFQVALVVKNLPANAGDIKDLGSIPGLGRFLLEEEMAPAPVFLPVKSLEQRRLEGYSPWGEKELDTTDRLTPSLSHFPVLLISSLAITSTLK